MSFPVPDESQLVDAITEVERQIAALTAHQLRLMAELVRREQYAFCGGCDDPDPDARRTFRHDHDPIRAVGAEISAALTWSPRFADGRAALAVGLERSLPNTLQALADGRIDVRKAELIADTTRTIGHQARQSVEAGALVVAPDKTLPQLRRWLESAVVSADPAAAEERRALGRRDRRVDPPSSIGIAGIAELTLTGPAEDLTALFTAVDAAARAARAAPADGDSRTLDQLRFDTMTGLGWTALAIGHLGCCAADCREAAPSGRRRLGTVHGRPATVNVTVALSTLVGLDDEPAQLDGHGPVPAHVARTIAGDATLRRLVTDPTQGRVLEYGRTTYEPPQALADLVVARDRTCRFPTSDTPARSCDIDHVVPWSSGGTTGAGNNHALSRRFHLDKTHHGWTLDQPEPGVLRWISPAGKTYLVPPEVVGPIIHLVPDPAPSPPPAQPVATTADRPPF